MSKIWITILLIIMITAVCFSGCGKSSNKEPREIQTEVPTETQAPATEPAFPMPIYTDEEIRAAMDVVKAKFEKGFEGCELLRLEYIEGKYVSDYEYYAKRCAIDRVIVLESDYYAGPDAPPSLNQDHTYDNWKWILIDDGSGWSVWTSGYG